MLKTTVHVNLVLLVIVAFLLVSPLTSAQVASHRSPPVRPSDAKLGAWAVQKAPVLPASAAVRQLTGNQGWGEDLLGNHFAYLGLEAPETIIDISRMTLDTTGAEFIDGDYGTLLVITADGALSSVDIGSGALLLIGTAAASAGQEFSGLAQDPTTGTLYASSTNCQGTSFLYTIDPSTAVATPVGGSSGNASCLVAIGFNAAGELYGVDVESDMLLSISTITASASPIGSLGFDANYSQGMDFDPDTDTCYLFAYDGSLYQAQLRTCDTTTGASTLVGNIGGSSAGTYSAFGGAALAPTLFVNGFESGDTSLWSATGS